MAISNVIQFFKQINFASFAADRI